MQKAKDERRQRQVAARLRALRLELNYEQFEMADLIGISPQRWSYYENAKRQFDFDVAVVLCQEVARLPGKQFGVTMDYIYRGEQKAGVPLDFFRKMEKRIRAAKKNAALISTTNYDDAVSAAKRGRKSTRAKVAKAGAK